MSEHEVTVVHTPGDGYCIYSGVCRCLAVSETIVSKHDGSSADECGKARRALYVWEREHGEAE